MTKQVARVLKWFGEPLYRRAIRLQPQNVEAYATHVPILAAIATLTQPNTVAEFGAGAHSTSAFLNLSVFKTLTRLNSFENNAEWLAQVRTACGADERLRLRAVTGEIFTIVSPEALKADLIFVDDSDGRGRAKTLGAIAALKVRGVPVVVHDTDHIRIRLATRAFEHRFFFDALTPQTGVVWNGELRFAGALKKMNRDIRLHAGDLSAADLEGWSRLFVSLLTSYGQAPRW